MTQVDDKAETTELERLRARTKKMAEDRAYVQLILRLIEKLNPLPGLEDMLRNMLFNIVECVGGTNIKLYYWVGEELRYLDFVGECKSLAAIDDPDVAQVAETHEFIDRRGGAEEALLIHGMLPGSYTWTFPLLIGQDLVGVIKLENLHIHGESLGRYLPIFFSHAALILGNEIRNTLHRRTEENLHIATERLQLATQAGLIGIWDWDVVRDELIWDESMYRLYGRREGDFGGAYDAWIAAVHPDDKAYVDGEIQAGLRGEHEYAPEFRVIWPDGSVHYIKAASKTTYDTAGRPQRMVGINYDLTERRRAEEELRLYKDHLENEVQQRTADLIHARNAAEAANLAKSVFLSNMSHELRTPLNAILGFSALIRKNPALPERLWSNLDIINRSGEHLLALINDVLEMAKIEAGRVHLAIAPFDLGSLVREAKDMMQVRAEEKGLLLQIDQDSRFPRYVVGDEARLRQVLINLLGNAIKFTERGSVTLRLGTRQNAISHLLIEIEDTGPGIPPEDQQRIFEPFAQLGDQGASKGTGLGLTITRQFVQMMGGQIDLESEVGKGSLFRIDLPLSEARETDIAAALDQGKDEVVGLAPGQPRYRILIVEDQRDNQMLLLRLMETLGLDVRVAENGEEAVRIFQEWNSNLIWMDLRMPGMDGLEATRRIRQLRGGQEVKIIAVTASAFNEQQQEVFAAGMDDFVKKPYRFGEIYDCLARQLGLEFTYTGRAGAERNMAVKLTPAMLAAVPEALRLELKAALASLDGERITASIRRVGDLDADLARTLDQIAANFDYPAILGALKEAKS